MKRLIQEHGRTLGRSQVTALAATLVDYSTMLLLAEWLRVDYRAAVACGALAGALLNFFANRAWAFGASDAALPAAFRYALVSGVSLALNVALVWLVTEGAGIPYYISKIVVAVLVGLGWNYPLHKYWVFPAREMRHA